MKLVFHGDRSSRTIKLGYKLRKVLGKSIVISLWDGYSSQVYLTK